MSTKKTTKTAGKMTELRGELNECEEIEDGREG
jgi:hypothetical protein